MPDDTQFDTTGLTLIGPADTPATTAPQQPTTIVTPFAVTLPVRWIDTADGPVWCLSGFDALTLAGVWEVDSIRRLDEAVRRGGEAFADLRELGATPPGRCAPLRPPLDHHSLDARFRETCDASIVARMDALTAELRSFPLWRDRAAVLIEELTDVADGLAGQGFTPRAIGAALAAAATLALEAVPEPEIRSVEHAALCAITHHKPWRWNGQQWLRLTGPWGRGWLVDRPEFQRVAALVRLVHPDVPIWLTGEESATAAAAAQGEAQDPATMQGGR